MESLRPSGAKSHSFIRSGATGERSGMTEEGRMLAVAMIKLLIISIAMVGLVRLVVIVFIGDAQNDLAIRRLMQTARRDRNLEEASRK